MTGRVGIIWDSPTMFTRLIEDCGFTAELVTPHLLAAPFFRRTFSSVIIPGGFANPAYSSVIPALRACEGRIRRFIQGGGTLIAFGAGIDRPDVYDWLPVIIQYRFGFSEGKPEDRDDHPLNCIIEDYPETISIDGDFQIPDTETDAHIQGYRPDKQGPAVRMRMRGAPVLVEYSLGAGRIILTSLHEYPSRRFLRDICRTEGETLL
ncbi:type 1 glutamine amidotransferase family protein [Methanospirillum lacunae]|uniref:CobB/CobQ-like glutamine amidotransferase domain-containing protein n=1 Tax=Methanospirillum lacunae TaxID=668570 RepID=A0A2V2N2Z0_9EURY|nr:hypothetical protein [Methanospirillum lacunae]PWR70547.1 hypothetical protein DK846_14230 [Methanospirillum lacunae]